MAADIHVLHPRSPTLAGYLRIGHTGHRKLEAMHAAGKFSYSRVVFDAAHIREQQELLKSLKKSGLEVILDPNFAEMSMPGRHRSAVCRLPWANPDRPWQSSDFGPGRNLNVARAIAEFALESDANAVLAPSHLWEPSSDDWRATDLSLCEALREELDKLGGNDIAIDFQIIITNATLKDERLRAQLLLGVNSLPIENIWLRVSGFGATSSGVGARSYIEAVRELHAIGRPLVADFAGGFSGLSALAFGAVGGISHGVGQKETFNANDWKKVPSGGGGNSIRIYVHELDRYLTKDQLKLVFAAKGAKSRFGCNDPDCCRDIDDMFTNPDAHFVNQRARQLKDLSSVPASRRADHFILKHLTPAVSSSVIGSNLKIEDEQVTKMIEDAKSRLVRFQEALADLQKKEGTVTISSVPNIRSGSRPVSAVLGR